MSVKEQQEEDWVKYHGYGDTPVGKFVDLKFRDGSIRLRSKMPWVWERTGNGSDIVAYRNVGY